MRRIFSSGISSICYIVLRIVFPLKLHYFFTIFHYFIVFATLLFLQGIFPLILYLLYLMVLFAPKNDESGGTFCPHSGYVAKILFRFIIHTTGSYLNRTALPHLDFHTSQNTSEFVLLCIFLQQGQTGDCFYQKI